ncbi:helix-turn-helix domain-containing protein [Streptomyces chryseus]|uniref:AraC family transcriptional regulator n=1 Tax=Streptomyces chryseus TaxID=68186 RepID=A0ABQ3DP25_9ACTN|nr:helix-turn-helix domain-containing protein [Streptomyces chryseus]GGX03290.1 AraC family transcriptional regulator [Streptomyces chryseus]GHB06732.1 AraC family transcriptional regulator [Streptomyces chryseus]
MHTVAIAVVEDAGISLWELYELSIACTVFGIPHPDLADPWYDLRLCGTRKAAPTAGFSLTTPHGLDALAGADTVIVPSVPEACAEGGEDVPPELVAALRAAAGSGARMVSLCTGAFALAAAGLLDGRRATAHWQHTAALAARYPKVLVDDSVLYTDDGDVLTSAGATAALDLCLHLVRRDLGAQVAGQLARRLVVPAHRAGGQAQFIDQPVPETDDDNLGPALQWATARLHEPLTVEDMARRARMSPRTFHRRIQESTGTTPLKWLLARRLARAQALLETTDLPIDRVSEECGLGTAANLRRHFTLRVGVSPSDYRRNFAGASPLA